MITLSKNGWTTNAIGYKWIQYFDKYTKSCTTGTYCLLILDSYKSYISVQFDQYCKKNNIIILCILVYLLHILQPLDIGYFSLFKKLYSKQIENLVQLCINYITKLEFLPVFHKAFQAAFTEQNIKSRFRATGLVLYNPENVLSYLDLKLQTPTPLLLEEQNWTSKILQNPKKLESQSIYLKDCIVQYQNSFPSSINKALNQFVQGAKSIIYIYILLKAENKVLQKANQVKKYRKQKQKRCLQHSKSLTIQESRELVQDTRIEQEEEGKVVQPQNIESKQQYCSLYNQVGYNTCIYKQDQESIEVEQE